MVCTVACEAPLPPPDTGLADCALPGTAAEDMRPGGPELSGRSFSRDIMTVPNSNAMKYDGVNPETVLVLSEGP